MNKSNYAWLVVAGAFMLLFCSTGTQFYAFPVFFEAIVRDTGWARAETAAALSVGMFFSGITGMLIGGLLHKLGVKTIMLSGCIIVGIGYYLLSTIEKLWQLYVYYGLIVAVGAACISLVPNMSAVESWFTQKRSTALGIATTGIGVGGAVMAPLASWLITRYDWQTAFLFMAAIVITIGIPVSIFIMRTPKESDKARLTEKEMKAYSSLASGATLHQALRSRAFWGISLGLMLWACAYGIGIVHQVAFAVDIGIDRTAAAGAISLLAMFSIVGRLGFGKLGDIIDKRYVFIAGTCLQIVAFIVLIKTTNLTMLYIYACLIGLNVGSMAPILPGILADHFGHQHFGSIYGVALFTQTIGMVIGPISGGLIFDITGSYYSAFLVAAMLSFVAVIIVYLSGKPITKV
jgi:MFS family permease